MILELLALKELNKPVIIPQPKPETTVQVEPKKESKKPKPKPKLYKIVRGDTIQKIAKKHRQPVRRVLCANPKIVNPDLIYPSDTIKIPYKGQKLKCAKIKVNEEPSSLKGFSSSGNSYQPGQCVWALKNWRPELPNTWGNASEWLYNAQADGWATGSKPRVGAVGWTSGHVVLITAVHKDGTVSIKDMNGNWIPYEIGYGRYPSTKYKYIY